MFVRILRDSLFRQKRRKAVVLAAVGLGTAAAAALGDIALDVGDKVRGELKAFGANLVVLPAGGDAPVVVGGEDVSGLRVPVWLGSSDVVKVKDNFWKNNILALAPSLDAPAKIAGRLVILRGTWFERSLPLEGEVPEPEPAATPPAVLDSARHSTPASATNRGDVTRSDHPPAAGRGSGGGPHEAGAAARPAPSPAAMPSPPAAKPPSAAVGEGPAEPLFLTGLRELNPGWSVEGRWPDDRTDAARAREPEALVGRTLADALGLRPEGRIDLDVGGRSVSLRIAGILSTGGEEDGLVLAPIETVQALPGLSGRISRIAVRALTTPETAVYERLGKNPKDLSPAEFEKWTCTPFVSSIAYEIERAVPGSEARIVRRVADSEGKILGRISGLMTLIALMAALGSGLTVTSALTTSVLERRSEIGLLKAMGAGAPRVVGLFLAEAGILGLLGGLAGAGVGALMARWISTAVFGSPVQIRPLSVPLAVAAALAITSAGCILPARRIMKFRPFEVLRGL